MKNTLQRHFPLPLTVVRRADVHFRNLPLLVDKHKNKLVCKYISFRFCSFSLSFSFSFFCIIIISTRIRILTPSVPVNLDLTLPESLLSSLYHS